MDKVTFNRNSTSFPTQVTQYLKGLDFSTPDQHMYSFLKYYQNLVRVYFNNVDIRARGLLVEHSMGLGKSMVAIAVALDQIEQNRPVIFLLYKSLMNNLKANIRKYIKLRTQVDPEYKLGTIPESDIDAYINRTFQFVSMNAGNMMTQIYRTAQDELSKEFAIGSIEHQLEGVLKSGSLDGKTVIVDEAQNLFRAITNGAKNASAFYKLVMESNDCRLVFLSGTPISADPFELVACYNMIGNIEPNRPILPESYTDFHKYFVDPTTRKLKSKAKFQNRIMGLTSYVAHTHSIAKSSDGSTVQFPDDLGIKVIKVEMDQTQFTHYQFARDKEIEEAKKGPGGVSKTPANMSKPRAAKSSSYRQRSRQLSNWCPPKQFIDTKFSSIDTAKITPTDSESPKFIAILNNINAHPNTKGMVYSQFVGAGGLGALARYLEFHGYRLESSLSGYSRSLRFGDDSTLLGAPTPPITVEPVDSIDEVIKQKLEGDEKLVDGVDVGALGGVGIIGSAQRTTIEVSPTPPSYRRSPRSIRPSSRVTISHAKYTHFVSPREPDFDAIREKFAQYAASNKVLRTVSGLAMNEPVPSGLSIKQVRVGGDNGNDEWIDRYFDIDDFEVKGGSTSDNVYAFITGDIPEDVREQIINKYNNINNSDGSVIRLLLISSTGAEGIDLKGCRHVHILEPYWNWARISQVKSRAIRNDSHIELSPADRNVQTYVYLAVQPESATVSEPSTDVELWTETLVNKEVVSSFMSAVHETSIECNLVSRESQIATDGADFQCRMCNPDDLPLFIDDITQDMKTPDKCSAVKKQQVTAREVSIDGKLYYHTVDPQSPYGFTLYEYLKDLGAYRAVPLDAKIYTTYSN